MSAIRDTLITPDTQREPITGREADMARNNAGGYSFKIDPFAQLDRFLILGTDGGTYYVTQRELTKDNLKVVDACLAIDGPQVVNRIVEVSERALAPRNSQAIYALAAAVSADDLETRRLACDSIKRVCRIGTHLFEFCQFVDLLGRRGWGRTLKRGVADTLNELPISKLELHAIKYRQRHGWTYRDVLRLAHPETDDPWRKGIYDFMCGRDDEKVRRPLIQDFKRAQAATSAKEVLAILGDRSLPWEAIPDKFRGDPKVLAKLAESMPVTATVRNLSGFARAGLLTPMGSFERIITDRLTDADAISRSRAHPLLFLDAMLVHQSGGLAGRSRGESYGANQSVLAALEEAFRLAFANVEPANKRTYLGLDVSSSMTWGACAGSVVVNPRVGSSAMAQITLATEPFVHIASFTDRMVPLNIPRTAGLSQITSAVNGLPFGATDCALPMLDALDQKMEVDTFVVYTDNETWAGRIHPSVALRQYRDKMGVDARLVVVGMTSTGFSIADPADAGMLDVVGFSADTPAVIGGFSARKF